MTLAITLAIDAMGGDNAPDIVIEGVASAHKENPEVHFKIFGLEESVPALLEKHGLKNSDQITFIPCTEVISGGTEPRQAIRGFKDSSMRRAIMAVAEGEADGVVSAGNTGAYVVLSKLLLKSIPGISRPAITSLMPTYDGKGTVMLDLGANVHVPPEVLVQFCIMGQAFAKCVQGNPNPSVALLNIGSEEVKGTTGVKEAQTLIQETGVIRNYAGFVEGNDIFNGPADVIVTDGFTGNVAIKTAEGTVKFFSDLMKAEIKKRWLSKIGALFAKGAFNAMKDRLDPRRYNGAQFLGVRGISVKSHGGTDALGFFCAVNVAIDLVKNKVNQDIEREIAEFQEKMKQAPKQQAVDS